MDSIDTQSLIIIGAALVIAVVAIGAWFAYLKRRTTKLHAHYGPEFERALEQHGRAGAAKTGSDSIAR
jgi:hypothetical protein